MASDSNQTKAPSRVLITGGAGFIGSHLSERLVDAGLDVTVVDNFDDYYPVDVKRQNIAKFLKASNFRLIEGDVRDDNLWKKAFEGDSYDVVVHLAALAGVRPSIERPAAYMDVNIRGLQKLVDQLIKSPSTRLVFASSSSVYGNRENDASFVETDRVDTPYSPYAASKAAGELLCHAAHECYDLEISCLRFFTVYGPRQRPDLAINKFCQLIEAGKPIEVYGDGSTRRDYTYVADTVSGIVSAMTYNCPGFDIINLGRGEPVSLNKLIECVENSLGKKAQRIHKPEQTGDVSFTHADISKATKVLNYRPQTSIEDGIASFVDWYKQQTRVPR